MALDDPRRLIPRTDQLLGLPAVRRARERLSDDVVRAVVREAQDRARRGEIAPGDVEPSVLAALDTCSASSLTPVLNATGVVVHTNLGRAPLSGAALDAVRTAGGYVDVELDLGTGTRSRRGAGARAALLAACPPARDALVVNNGAAALVLATTALAAGREVVISRGELVEIGAGFRLPELIESTGARLREVGTTNRTHLRDYAEAIGPDTGCLLKVHPSNFRLEGFTSGVEVGELRPLARAHGVPLVADLGSGLLVPDPHLPSEPDAASALEAGADAVIASGDKLLGGPQAGIIVGKRALIARLQSHPLKRALRADKMTLAALEATLRLYQHPEVLTERLPTLRLLTRPAEEIRRLAERLLPDLAAHYADFAVSVAACQSQIGSGSLPVDRLPSAALTFTPHDGRGSRLEALAARWRALPCPVIGRIDDGRLWLDLRCLEDETRFMEMLLR